MDPAKVDAILARIDAAVGGTEDETDEEHEHRRQMIERDHAARVIRKAAQDPT